MDELPADLLQATPPDAVSVAQEWWNTLDEESRRRVAGLWDERLEVQFFTPQSDDTGCMDTWDQVPAVSGGRFVPTDDARGFGEWGPGYFEYLLQHPELVLAYEPARRTFHFGCTQHPAARACLVAGHVPADFQCPLGSRSCPLEPLRGSHLIK